MPSSGKLRFGWLRAKDGKQLTDVFLLARTNRQCIPAPTGLDAGDAVSELQGRLPAACSKVFRMDGSVVNRGQMVCPLGIGL